MQFPFFTLVLAWLTFTGVSPESAMIIAEHPRLFFRKQDWGEGELTLEVLKRRAGHEASKKYVQSLNGTAPNLALRSLLFDDQSAAREAIELLQRPMVFDEITTDEGVELAWRAIAFDWLYSNPLFTEQAKKAAALHIAAGADRLTDELVRGAHIFHTRMYGWATGIALAGLALYGDHPKAPQYAEFGYRYYRERLFPARKLQDGSVHNGFGYGRKYTMWLAGHFLSCWHSATGQNLWTLVRLEEGDWAYRELLFNIYGRYPDGSYLRFGDSYSVRSDLFSFRAVSERAWAYRDPVGYGFLEQLIEEAGTHPDVELVGGAQNFPEIVNQSTAYNFFLFYDPEAPKVATSTLPLKIRFSPNGTGMVIWKSGWGAGDTTVFFKCGNYFGDHGHFDQGHVDIFRRAPLLIDSGSYLTFSGPFRMDYWRKTVAHNTLLIVDPNEPDDEGGQRIFHSQSDASIQEYLANRNAETGEILDYHETPRLSYVAGDLTSAYPSDRVRRVIRELAFLDDRYLLVVDRVETSRANLVPKVLWHCPVKPRVEPDGRTFELSRNGSRVTGHLLLPPKARLGWVEGFRVGTKVVEPRGHLKGLADMGVGRLEVVPEELGGRFLFLQLFEIADEIDPRVEVEARLTGDFIEVRAGQDRVRIRTDSWSRPQD